MVGMHSLFFIYDMTDVCASKIVRMKEKATYDLVMCIGNDFGRLYNEH